MSSTPLPMSSSPAPFAARAAPRAAACAALTALLCLLSACGGGAGAPAAEPPANEVREPALAVSQPGDLARWAQAKLRERQAQGISSAQPGLSTMPSTSVAMSPAATATSPARSRTLLQEEGVDEADLLLSDGTQLYTLQPAGANSLRLQVLARAADGVGPPRSLKTLLLSDAGAADIHTDGMHLSADNRSLTVLSQSWFRLSAQEVCVGICNPVGAPVWMRSGVGVQRVDVTVPAAAAAGDRLSIDGHLVDSRRIGDTLYLVTVHSPQLPVDLLPSSATAAEREALIARLSAADILPKVRRNGGAPQPLLADTDCYVQPRNASWAIEVTTITVIDLKSATLAHSSRCFVGGSEALTMSRSSLYLATTRWPQPLMTPGIARVFPGDAKTDLHKFALQGGSVVYKGSGQVAGHLGWDAERKSLRLSEFNGDLRVLSFTGSEGWTGAGDATAGKAASPATLSVLRERSSDSSLQVVATLPNSARPAALGKAGEQVHGVRFAGARAYLVTFRRIDPLYVLDLSQATDPRIVGELESAGFSDHLFPLDNGLLLAVGRHAAAQGEGRVDGLMVALFDVGNPARPTLLSQQVFGGAASQMTLDRSRQGMNLLMKGAVARMAMPVNLFEPQATRSTYGLQRLEVNTQARTLSLLPLTGGGSSEPYRSTWLERSLQIGEQVFYLSDGGVKAYTW